MFASIDLKKTGSENRQVFSPNREIENFKYCNFLLHVLYLVIKNYRFFLYSQVEDQ